MAEPGRDRRDYGDGSMYQRSQDWRWIATTEAGWTAGGVRRRVTVSSKGCVGGCKPRCSHVAEIKRRLREKKAKIETEGLPTVRAGVTVKAWADDLTPRKLQQMRPKGFNAWASPVRKWIVPTIGQKRLDTLSAADVRAVTTAVRSSGGRGSSLGNAAAVHRALMTLLNAAVAEGHTVPAPALMVPAPKANDSDRIDLTLEETIRCLEVASYMPHGVRWALALLYGPRQNEVLGLTEDCLDFERREIWLRWQLQALPYIDPKNKALGFRIPDHFDKRKIRHLVDSWHLVPVKTEKGIRVLPMIDPVAEALEEWLKVRPPNPWGLVFPTASGRPAGDKPDREEFWAIQYTASVADAEPGAYAAPLDDLAPVFHPEGERFYHVHECRNVAATQLHDVGASELVQTSMLGHTSIGTTRRYQTAHLDAKRTAAELVAARIMPERYVQED